MQETRVRILGGLAPVGWTSRLSLTSLTITVLTFCIVDNHSCITKSIVALYNFVFHISCSTCTSSVPYIYVVLHLSVYYIYMLYIYTLISQCIYIYVLYPILSLFFYLSKTFLLHIYVYIQYSLLFRI